LLCLRPPGGCPSDPIQLLVAGPVVAGPVVNETGIKEQRKPRAGKPLKSLFSNNLSFYLSTSLEHAIRPCFGEANVRTRVYERVASAALAD
jgi:hypothetical protein